MDDTGTLWMSFAVVAIFLALVIVNKWKVRKLKRKLQKEPLEEFAVVFGMRWDNSAYGLRAQEVTPGDDLYLVTGIRRAGRVTGPVRHAYRIYLGKVTRVEPGIIEAQGKGRMHEEFMIPEKSYKGTGVKTDDVGWQLTRMPKGIIRFSAFDAIVLEVRPVCQESQVWPKAAQIDRPHHN